MQLLLLITIVVNVFSQHAWYSGFQKQFGVSVKQNFIWGTIPQCSSWGCNQAFASTGYATNGGGDVSGYFGMQQTAQGMYAIFSVWDYSSSEKTSQGMTNGCSRFGGEGQGSHCMLRYNFQSGVTYEMEVYVADHNSQGTTFTGVIVNRNTGDRKYIGNIHSARPSSGQIATSVMGQYSFLEYFSGGNFLTTVGMVGPYIDYSYPPTKAYSDCDGSPPSSVTSCIPGRQCAAPNVYFQKGPSVAKKCGYLWNGLKITNQTKPLRFGPIYKSMGDKVWENARSFNDTRLQTILA